MDIIYFDASCIPVYLYIPTFAHDNIASLVFKPISYHVYIFKWLLFLIISERGTDNNNIYVYTCVASKKCN